MYWGLRWNHLYKKKFPKGTSTTKGLHIIDVRISSSSTNQGTHTSIICISNTSTVTIICDFSCSCYQLLQAEDCTVGVDEAINWPEFIAQLENVLIAINLFKNSGNSGFSFILYDDWKRVPFSIGFILKL